MKTRLNEIMEKLTEVDARSVRIESRLVQLMNHLGIKPKGAIPEDKRKLRE